MGVARPRALAAGALAALAAAGALAADAAPPPSAPPLAAMRWAAPGADPRRAFAEAPAECLAIPADPDLARRVEVGRAAFRTPVLLGGQAARAGISCETCHRSGRANPDFQFPGVSGAPGTADVTSSLFSSHRGNGIDDPRPIPDLSGPRSGLKVAPADLRGFIHGLIVEEFDGPEPPPAVLDGLTAYVQALDPGACPARVREPVTLAGLMADARRAVRAAEAEAARGETAAAVVMAAGARARLGLIDERYAALPLQRQELRTSDRDLAEAQDALRADRPDARRRLGAWLEASEALEARLAAAESASLFDPALLMEAANRRLQGKSS